MSGYWIESFEVYRPEELEQEWLELQGRADCSYFQSWGWIGTWLEEIAGDLSPRVIKVRSGRRLIGMGLFVSTNIRRHSFIRSRAMFLNEYPFEGKNMVIEYNGLLAERGCEDAVYAETIRYLLRKHREMDEFYFGAVADSSIPERLDSIADERLDLIVNEESVSWQVDLSRLAPGLDDYLASLSKNRRGQIRRSFRLYEKFGPLELYEARDTEEAQQFFDGLKVLHTERWRLKNKSGLFVNSQWESFHRSLIQARFKEGEIQLLKVGNSHSTIGYLYNFMWRGCVYVLQTGFSMCADNRLMPGYVVHALAIAYNKSKGMSEYDLMHGDSLYKRILCNQSRKLCWVVLQRRRFKFAVEKLATDMARRYRAL